MYGLLVQVHLPLFALLFRPYDCELWFTINWISEKSTVNTCKMFTLRFDFLAASLPRIPSHIVLCLFFSLAMSSTMIRSFLYHVVRDRECIQSSFVMFFWIRCQSSIVRKCNKQFLDSQKEQWEHCTFGIISHNLNNSTLPNARIIAFELFAEWVVDVILLQIGMKCFAMRMIFDLFHKLLISEMYCFFHNCMWQSWYSEINFVLLFQIHQYGSLRTCLIFFNMCKCQHDPHTGLRVLDHWALCYGSIRWVSWLIPTASESKSHIQLTLQESVGGGRGHIYLLVYDFFFRDTISWECIVEDDCITSWWDRTSILLSWASCISTKYTVSWCLLHFCLYDAETWFGQIKLMRIFVILIHGIHSCIE